MTTPKSERIREILRAKEDYATECKIVLFLFRSEREKNVLKLIWGVGKETRKMMKRRNNHDILYIRTYTHVHNRVCTLTQMQPQRHIH